MGVKMNLKDIKEMAKQKGIKVGKMRKHDLVRSIQRAEGNFSCFKTATLGECSQENCLWREDCLSKPFSMPL
jgi:hypothetical protein